MEVGIGDGLVLSTFMAIVTNIVVDVSDCCNGIHLQHYSIVDICTTSDNLSLIDLDAHTRSPVLMNVRRQQNITEM